MKSNFSIVLFRISVSLFIFCPEYLSIGVIGVLKSTIIGSSRRGAVANESD